MNSTPSDKHQYSVLFVCLGNICRSPAAQGIMQEIVDSAGETALWHIDSAGTAGYHVGEQPDRRMRLAARNRGITLDHQCRRVCRDDFDRFDIIIAMDESNYRDLRAISPSPETDSKIYRMSEFFSEETHRLHTYVPDPYYEGAEGFETVLDLLADGCANLRYHMTHTFEST